MERFDSGRLSTTLVIICTLLRYVYILFHCRNSLVYIVIQVRVDYGIFNYYIETIRASCIELTQKNYFALPAARVYPRTPRTDVKLDSYRFAKGSSFSGCPSIVGCIVLRMRYNRDYIYEDAFPGSRFFYQKHYAHLLRD